MIKIVSDKRLRDFDDYDNYKDYDESSDGMMRSSFEYTVHIKNEFIFTNEQKDTEGHYIYDMQMLSNGEDYTEYNKRYVFERLKENNIYPLNFNTYRNISIEAKDHFNENGKVITNFELSITEQYMGKKQEELISYDELPINKNISKEDKIKIALGIYGRKFFAVDSSTIPKDLISKENTIPKDFFPKQSNIQVEFKSLEELIKSNEITIKDVQNILLNMGKDDKELPLNDYIIDIIKELPTENINKILHDAIINYDYIDFYREYAPECIYWKDVPDDKIKEGDFELLTKKSSGDEPDWYLEVYFKTAELSKISQEDLAKTLKKDFSEQTLYRSIEARELYKKYNFIPGLKWLEEEKERQKQAEILNEKKKEEIKKSTDEVVKYVNKLKRFIIPIKAEQYTIDPTIFIYDEKANMKEIGKFNTHDERLLIVDGLNNSYIINVEKIKNMNLNVLHLDVLEEDARHFIGPKGKHINELMEDLNYRGCHLKNIQIHTYQKNQIKDFCEPYVSKSKQKNIINISHDDDLER